jgi:S1-C subfamily serine protease/predicted esterase
MSTRSATGWLLTLAAAAFVSATASGQGVNEAYEKAAKQAAAKVAPSVVKIETSGGRELIGGPSAIGPGAGVRKGTGPTTGVVVDKDGYLITSAFNFANKPTDIFVTVPGRQRLVAKVVANDTTRMLTLLKVDAKDLPVPPAVPKSEVRVGQTALALGRTLDPEVARLPSISLGIVSATGRIWGKAIQTDAKVSPFNYGGPLVALDGRVMGVLVPASPRGDTEIAGLEWYDSGIGFAIPLEDVFAVLPRLKEGKDLHRGLVGITPKSTEEYVDPVEVGTVAPGSAAEKAGIKPGDRVVAIDGKPITNMSQLQHALGPRYEGDTVGVTILRDGKEEELKGLVLTSAVTAYTQPFLGILPMRDDPEPGVEVRFVYPKSPADAAGVKPGDRITKFAPASVPALAPVAGGRAGLARMVGGLPAGTEVKVEVKRKDGGKTETLTVKLGPLPDDVPEKLPLPSSAGKALERPKGEPAPKDGAPKKEEKPAEEKKKNSEKKDEEETGLLKRTHETTGREYWVYVPENYDKNVAHGLVVWFHAAGKGGRDADDLVKIWQDYCEDHHFILVGPKARSNDGWVASETEEVVQVAREVLGRYTLDRSRVVAHGMGVGGQMAFYVGFHARDLVRGVAVTGAVPGSQPKDTVQGQPLSFFIVAGQKDPLLKEITEGKDRLVEKKFPVVYREIADFGKEYLDEKTFREMRAWMDSLDKI